MASRCKTHTLAFLHKVACHMPKRRKCLSLLLNPVFPTSIGPCFCWNPLPVFPEHHNPKQSQANTFRLSQRTAASTSTHLLGLASPNLSPKATPAMLTKQNFCWKIAQVILYQTEYIINCLWLLRTQNPTEWPDGGEGLTNSHGPNSLRHGRTPCYPHLFSLSSWYTSVPLF